MAYIQPNSTILLIRGVPFEPDYDHTVLFPDASSQATVIHGSAKYTLNPNTYQRVNKNTCRVGLPADNLYDCNYMAFQNTAFGSKWFYAFIKEVNYINNECTEIVYEIDSFQSYLFDFRIGDCFVEREHPITDAVGDNIIPEELNVGDLVLQGNRVEYADAKNVGVYILVATDESSISLTGNLFDNTFQGGSLFCIPINQGDKQTTESAIRQFLSAYNNTPEKIIGIWTGIYTPESMQGYRVQGFGGAFDRWNDFDGISAITGNETFGSYLPHNKKLYTYPYSCFMVTSTSGGSHAYRYEFFNYLQPDFVVKMSKTFPSEAMLIPRDYKGGGDTDIMCGEGLVLKGWSSGSWTSDTWTRMMNISAIDYALSLVSGAIGTGITGRMTSFGIHASGGVEQALNVMAKKDFISPTNSGNASSTAMGACNSLTFFGGRYGVTEQFAKMIDSYFDMYGYQTNRLKTPEINSRPHWNYVKVSYADVHGNVPAEHIVNIKNALRRGITFWKSMSEVGHYEYDNRPY